jgi:hypothetical protein
MLAWAAQVAPDCGDEAMKRTHLMALAGLCLLAACGKGGNVAPANTAPAPVDTVITPAQFPTPKAGYWAETDTDNGGTPETRYQCENGAPISTSDMAEGCSSLLFKHLANGSYTIDMQCSSDGVTKSTHVVFKGDPNSAFSMDGTRTSGGPGQPTTSETHHEDAHFAGPCPSG